MASRRQAGAADPAGQRELLSAGDVARTIARIAHQIIEKTALDTTHGDVVLLGIPTRGTPLAHRLAERISEFSGVTVPTGTLDITLYRDDLRTRPNRPLEPTSLPPRGVDGSLVVLVDDAHWADDASAALVPDLARRLVGTRCTLVASYRVHR